MGTDLVGRRDELAVLSDCLHAALAGRARLVLCRGEPGIGKSRLAEEVADRAAARGAVVAWGVASEAAGAPPHWPWPQVLRTVDAQIGLRPLAAQRRLAADLGYLAPELFPDPGARPDEQMSDETRFRSFEAVAELLREATRLRPVLIVLDDAHRCGRSALLLVRHLARSMAGHRLMVLVNHRDTEPIPDVLTDLLREPSTRELPLRGLSLSDVGVQLTALLGTRPTDGELRRVHARTGGNPFYVAEIARVLRDPRTPAKGEPVPRSVRAAIAARLARLAPDTALALQAASVVGREFSVSLVARMLDVPVSRCLEGADEADAAGLIEATSAAGQFRFVHDLVRDAVEAGLVTSERVRLHRSAADAIEASGNGDGRLADLARHWAVAAAAGDRPRAVDWIRRAAEEAMHRLAYEEAARLYRLAVTVGASDLDDDLRCRLLVALGRALQSAGDLAERLAVTRQAAELARRLRRPDLLAAAALVLEGGEAELEPEVALRRWCEEALAGLHPGASVVRARVLATLSDACMYLGDVDAAGAVSAEALSVAESSGDALAVAAALRARQLVATGPDGVEERSRLAERMAEIGRETRNPATAMWAHLWRIDVAFQRGDLGSVDRELHPLAQAVEAARSRVARWHLLQCRAVLAQAQGRFADARSLADQALAALPPSGAGYGSALINRTGLLGAVALHTGDSVDLDGLRTPGARDDVDGDGQGFSTAGVIFSVAAAFILAVRGRREEASRVYRRLGPPAAWQPIPHSTTVCWAFGIGAAVALGARDDVVALSERLAPYRGQHVVSGAGAVAYDGPVELWLGMAAGFLGRLDEAIADLETAVHACAANGAAGFAVQAACELAAVLERRAGSGDGSRARELAADAASAAEALGMRPWADRARRLLARLDDGPGSRLTPRERNVAGLVAQGLTNRQIATRLHISERTAQNHVQHILTKLDLANRSQLAVLTVREISGTSD